MPDVCLPQPFRSSVINFKTLGATLLINPLASKRFLPTRAWLEFTASTFDGSGPILTMGNNATNYDNVHQGTTISGSVNAIRDITLFVSGGRFSIDIGSVGIYVRVATAATYTTCQGIVFLEGLYR